MSANEVLGLFSCRYEALAQTIGDAESVTRWLPLVYGDSLQVEWKAYFLLD
jgi:hypothetical protein